MAELKAIFDDLPVTQWENLETGKYWAKMVQNGWKQNVDQSCSQTTCLQNSKKQISLDLNFPALEYVI